MNWKKHWRIFFLIAIIFSISGAIITRLFWLQIIRYDFYAGLAQDQYSFFKELFPQRGEIFIQDLKSDKTIALAVNKEYQQVYVVPRIIAQDKKEDLSKNLASLLDLDQKIIFDRLSKPDDPYEPLKSKVDDAVAGQIKNLDNKGVKLASLTGRYYPAGTLASQLVGFLGVKDDKKTGQYGLEEYYENDLKGRLGSLSGEKDTIGRFIPTANQQNQPAENGVNIVLTIDQNIQFKAENELKKAIDKWQADKGTIIVSNPSTGAIYAMASYPNFDPNNYSEVKDINVFLNPANQMMYEPGSVMKIFTMAAGLDSASISFDQTYEDKGFVALAGGVIKNALDMTYGVQSMSQILEKSINTGAVYVQQKIGSEKFRDYLQAFGFGSKTQIDLVGEIEGSITNLFSKREIDLATASFGQGIAVTPIQLISAASAIANQGRLLKPYLVEKKIFADNQQIKTEPAQVRQVISQKTADQLTKMMVQVVENGHGKLAKIPGYSIAGKTGTAEVPNPDKPGYSEDINHTFIGFAPAFNPKFAVLVKLDKPKGVRWAETTVVPIFKEIAQYLFNYFEIPPQ